MAVIEKVCDRCKAKFTAEEYAGVTCGFYDVSAGYWAIFARDGEKVVCDTCMWADPEYKRLR